MKKILLILLLALPVFAGEWMTDHDRAVSAAKKAKKPLFVLLTSDRSVNSDYMLRKVLTKDGINTILNKRYICLRSDFDRETWFSGALGQLKLFRHPLPVILIFSNGRIVFHNEGLIPAGRLESVLARHASIRSGSSTRSVAAPRFEEAYADFQAQRWDDALVKFGQIDDGTLSADQKIGKHFSLGVLSYMKKDYDNAVMEYLRAEAVQSMPNTLYNLACAYSLSGDRSGALYYLENAVRTGFSDLKAVQTDPDLAPIRQTKEYASILLLISAPASPAPTRPKAPTAGPNSSGGVQATRQEKDCFDQVNLIRTAKGRPPLRWADDLLPVARGHSQDMANRNFFDHTNPDGKNPFQRMEGAGLTYSTAAENIAYNQGYNDPVPVAVKGWEDSPGHYRNIINSDLTEAAIGIATGSDGSVYFTQVFMTRR